MSKTNNLEKLLAISSAPLRPDVPEIPTLLSEQGSRGRELYQWLSERNGFFAFESALHVFPLGTGRGMDLETWNTTSLWRSAYGDMAEGLLFFAEDTFGHPFAIRGGDIVSFDPESGKAEALSPDLEGWAERILDDYEILTGYPLLHEWQERNGPIPLDHRLAPRIPFVAGGDFSLKNLYLAPSVDLMRFRASLAQQIKDLPDGTPIRLKVT